MLRVVRPDKTWRWSEVVFDLPSGIVEVLSIGYLSLDGCKIVKNYDTWTECLMFLIKDLVFVFSLGHFCVSWSEKNDKNH